MYFVEARRRNRNYTNLNFDEVSINTDRKGHSTSTSSTISTDAIEGILTKLKHNSNRISTQRNYLSVWRSFNNFLIKLDRRPDNWEDRICLYAAYMVKSGLQSGTVKSYYSAIKAILKDDGYMVDDTKVLITSLARACKLVNDKVRTRLPIKKNLLEIILFEIERRFGDTQPYLEIMYKTIIALGYYGLFRIGELTLSDHTVKAADVHIGQNKNKLLFILYTSKTHGWESRPQKVKITEVGSNTRYFCPFALARRYFTLRGGYIDESEPFFVFHDKRPVSPAQVRDVLRKAIISVNLSPNHYGFHSLRVGRCSDLIFFGKSISQAKIAGRWRSNAVFKYIRN